jgi:type I restriction-modification system DNA methylase subunit
MEKNITTYNLARIHMLLHGVKDSEFEIYHGDTLTNDWDMLRETNPAKGRSKGAKVDRIGELLATLASLGQARVAGDGRFAA